MTVPLSILDLATVDRGTEVGAALHQTVAVARRAEELGYTRVWYAEHHNMRSIASSATSVLIAHVAAHTSTIRLGAGGVMLPNHSPLTIAEQFGTLAALHPGRIDLGLGRAPGTDQVTLLQALRRDHSSADTFPRDVQEVQAFLGDESPIPGVHAYPGRGTRVPLYILGSSLYGAQLAAALGLPYGFASHFAPEALQSAVRLYRERYTPSDAHPEPYVIAGVNVIAADTEEEAAELQLRNRRRRLARFLAPDRELTDEQADELLASPQGQQVLGMMRYTAAGTPAQVRETLDWFAEHADADELIVVHSAPGADARLRSIELTAEAVGLVPVAG